MVTTLFLIRLISRLTIFLFLLIFCAVGTWWYIDSELPTCDHLNEYTPPVMTRVFTQDLQLLREFSIERRVFTPFNAIPPRLIQAFIAAEDRHFFEHYGLDIFSTARAFIENTVRGSWKQKPVGASTITQQVAKNFLVGNERSLKRKIREAMIAVRLENTLSKERILELYLNEIYLGGRAYGVAAAALRYFNKSLNDLDFSECAFLASLPKAPSFFYSEKHTSRVKERRNWVLSRMHKAGFITSGEYEKAQNTPLKFTPYSIIQVEGNYFTEQVRKDLLEQFGENGVYFKGLTVFSTMDPDLQKTVERALFETLLERDKALGFRKPAVNIIKASFKKENQPIPENIAEFIDELSWPNDPSFEVFFYMPEPKIAHWMLGAVIGFTIKNKITHLKVGLKNGAVITVHPQDHTWLFTGTNHTFKDRYHVGDVVYLEQQDHRYKLQQIPEITGGMVVMDPETGHVLALSGGFDFKLNQYNIATQAERQPGSAFKPFVYMAALEQGYQLHSIIDDSPLNLYLGPNLGFYSPKNYTNRSYGPTALRVGLEQSRNQMTVRLAHQIGMIKVAALAKRFGIYDQLYTGFSSALGAYETTLLKLTTAYSMIANGGKKISPTLISKVQNGLGDVIYTPPIHFISHLKKHEMITIYDEEFTPRVIDNREAIIKTKITKNMMSCLKGAVDHGTARRLRDTQKRLNLNIFAKTGTSNHCKDAWIVAIVEPKTAPKTIPMSKNLHKENSLHNTHTNKPLKLVIGVFVGHALPKSMGETATGGIMALPVLKRFLNHYYS